ncbi:hypothetical protein DFH09DRAFT_1150808 [Mycena vulgaris]|nr:hypothetical protein DFH09DRAFT_1214732 [Mycena vulgaris]KAJ6575661.1 hypothetical protein DFH09DRAFT_1150808 [Mycena vulgaris]
MIMSRHVHFVFCFILLSFRGTSPLSSPFCSTSSCYEPVLISLPQTYQRTSPSPSRSPRRACMPPPVEHERLSPPLGCVLWRGARRSVASS